MALDPYHVRPATADDLDALVALAGCDGPSSWGREAFAGELALSWSTLEVLVEAAWPARACGFVVFWRVADGVELLNIAVAPEHRRRGLGGRLVEHVLARARALGAGRVFLEVREGNTGAIRLYERAGFVATGRRAGYYQQSGEDAVLMTRDLIGGAP